MRKIVINAQANWPRTRPKMNGLPAPGENHRRNRHGPGRRADSAAFVLDLSATMAKLEMIKPDVVFNLVETVRRAGRHGIFRSGTPDVLAYSLHGQPHRVDVFTSGNRLPKKFLQPTASHPDWITADGAHCSSGRPCAYLIKPCWEDASVGLDEEAFLPQPMPKRFGMPCNSGKRSWAWNASPRRTSTVVNSTSHFWPPAA